MTLSFLKMHGLGNDFVILDQRDQGQTPDKDLVTRICDRHFGVGCDLLAILEPSDQADIFLRFYNADGSEAESCGNATRCAADIILREQGGEACTIETRRGVLTCRKAEDMIEVDMGAPLSHGESEIEGGPALGRPYLVDMGNPHCVFFVDDAEEVDIYEWGPLFETHEDFPNRSNVEFVEIRAGGTIRLRVWERGAGVTLACGSGACAVLVAAAERGLAGPNAEIEMDGGTLFISRREEDGHLLMTGPVAYVFDGKLRDV